MTIIRRIYLLSAREKNEEKLNHDLSKRGDSVVI